MLAFLQSFSVQISSIVVLSLLPVLIWLSLVRNKEGGDKLSLKKAFLAGMIFALPILSIKYFWIVQENLSLSNIVYGGENTVVAIALTAMFVGLLTELTKFLSLVNLRWFKVQIKNVKEAMFFSLAVALGFAFTENAADVFGILRTQGFETLFSTLVIKYLLVIMAQMLFSAIVAYYYAIGRFGSPILALDYSTGKSHKIAKLMGRVLRLKIENVFFLSKLGVGLTLAMLLHASFSSMMQFGRIESAAIVVIVALVMALYLSQQKISYLALASSPDSDEKAEGEKIDGKEMKVITDLLSQWIKDEDYDPVIDLCERLTIQHPNNSLLKLIKAKATDKKKVRNLKKNIKKIFLRKEESDANAGYSAPKYQHHEKFDEGKISKKKNSLGLVLSGGGIRGCLHLGFYQVLQENGIEVDFITGTSMGALIGSALALGQDIELIKNKVMAQRELNAYSFENFNFFNESLIKQDFLRRGVKIMCEDKSFADLKIPFACVAINLENGEEVVFTDGPLEPAVAASASLPMVFPPVYYRDSYLVDGGIKNNLPCMACRNLGAQKLIAISISNNKVKQHIAGEVFMRHDKIGLELAKKVKKKKKSLLEKKKDDFSLFLDILMQSIGIASGCCYQQELEASKPDLLIQVTCDYELFDFENIDNIVEIGRKAALENLDKIKAVIKG